MARWQGYALTGGFFVMAALVLAVLWVDRRPPPIYKDQFTHPEARAVPIMRGRPLDLRLQVSDRPKVLRVPFWIDSGRQPVRVEISVDDPASAPTQTTLIRETQLAELPVPSGGRANAPLRVRMSTEGATPDAWPRILWAKDPPLVSMQTWYGGVPIRQIEVLPSTGPLVMAEYPWPSRMLLAIWLVVGVISVVAWRKGGAWRPALLIAVALAVTVSSALLWQRDYTRRAPHLDADDYVQSAEQMALFVEQPSQRSSVASWFGTYPHATTQLAPALLLPGLLVGLPATYAYMLLSALACWLALLAFQRAAVECLGLSVPLSWGLAVAFTCHPVVLRTFARPITDGVGLLLVVWTLWLLLRRFQRPGPWDEMLLALLVLAHPLARPQGFAYWPFIAVSLLIADRVRLGDWPPVARMFTAVVRVFFAPTLILIGLYWQFDWWHNVDLMLAKARRFRLDSTLRDFVDSGMGVLLFLPLLWLVPRSRSVRPSHGDPRAVLLWAWVIYVAVTLIAVRAPFWLRHFLPIVPAIYWLVGMRLDQLKSGSRRLGWAVVYSCALIGLVVTLWQIEHLEPFPPWLAGIVTVP